MRNEKVTQHRLGIARSALKRITRYYDDPLQPWDTIDIATDLRIIAEDALRQMHCEVNKKARQREHDRDVWVARLAREVKNEVPE